MKRILPGIRFIVLAAAVAVEIVSFAPPSCSQEKNPYIIEETTVEAPDGVRLATTVARPDRDGRFPTIVYRSPYGSGWMKSLLDRYAGRGYVCVFQDVRGRNKSEGVFDPFVNEIPDGDALLRWIRSRPWSNGTVGASGHSYIGFTALYLAAGKEKPPSVIVASDPVASPRGGLYTNGAMNHHFDYYWAILVDGKDTLLPETIGLDWDRLFALLPLRDAPRGVSRELPHYRKWVDWANGSFGKGFLPETSRISRDGTAVYLLGGWFDLFCTDVLELYGRLNAEGPKGKMKLIVGPFDHGNSPPPGGEMDFGDWKSLDTRAFEDRWLDRWLKNEENGAEGEPPVRFFLMGENRWVSADTWPPAGVSGLAFHLRGGGKANTLRGDGRLETAAPGNEPPDVFIYDPGNPAPTRGGSICCLREMTKAGSMDQRTIEERGDVLVYTSAVLDRNLTIAGPVELEIFAATSERDTDFTGKLTDVLPDGRALNIVEGIVRARFRDGMGSPRFVTPGTVERYRFTLGHTAMTFRKGHRMRLEVSSSDFPRFDRNLNTGGVIGSESVFIKAEQTIHHDGKRPSRLILPVWEPDGKPGSRR